MRLRGGHNLLDASAAVACAAEAGASSEAIASALSTFEGLPHRTTFVVEIAGVRYYDDSKGTNVGAAVSALRGLGEAHVVLIAGGRDKRGSVYLVCTRAEKNFRLYAPLRRPHSSDNGLAIDTIPGRDEPLA